jgi:hypothetical protein
MHSVSHVAFCLLYRAWGGGGGDRGMCPEMEFFNTKDSSVLLQASTG